MRKTRKESLDGASLFHKFWRGHNREAVLESDEDKDHYLQFLADAYSGDIKEKVKWYSFCLMPNHPHESGEVLSDKDHDYDDGVYDT